MPPASLRGEYVELIVNFDVVYLNERCYGGPTETNVIRSS